MKASKGIAKWPISVVVCAATDIDCMTLYFKMVSSMATAHDANRSRRDDSIIDGLTAIFSSVKRERMTAN